MLKYKRPFYFLATAGFFILLSSLTNPASHYAGKASSPKVFPLELDHVLVWVTKGGPEVRELQNLGLRSFGETSRHVGQGTASKVFLFENVYLELIWIDSETAAKKNEARTGIDMGTRARWRQTGASPFGVGLHRLPGAEDAIPFPTIRYWAEWMKPNTEIEFSEDVTSNKEPMYFIVPEYLSVADPATQGFLSRNAAKNAHLPGMSKLTNLIITTTNNKLTPTGKSLARGGIVTIRRGTAPLMEITFDNGKQGKRISLKPQLPVIFKY